MIQVDLITGFLGSGKTTFLKKYAAYWKAQGVKIAILENDFGAVNVDMMLLQELEDENCMLEMVSGGCCARDHRRRFHTKLIALAMSQVERVIIEPSGIFDVDEFFDALHDEPLDRFYEIGNVIAIVDATLEDNLSRKSEYVLASQLADAGSIILSKMEGVSDVQVHSLYEHIQRAMKQFRCTRKLKEEELIYGTWETWTEEDMAKVTSSGYRLEDFVKISTNLQHEYQSVYLMNHPICKKRALEIVKELYAEPAQYGSVFRVKGFLRDEDGWLELNATVGDIQITEIPRGQEVLIVIGDGLQESAIQELYHRENV